MTISVREALELPPFRDGVLVAGRDGLGNRIRWVTIVEYLEDASLLQDGELLITTAYSLEGDLERRRTYISDLANNGQAALVVLTGFYIGDIPQEMIDQADEFALPLIKLPPTVNFSEITRAILERIVNRQYELLHSSEMVHQELSELALRGRDLPDIAAALAHWVCGRVLICGINWDVITAAGQAQRVRDIDLVDAARKTCDRSDAQVDTIEFHVDGGEEDGPACLAAPIQAGERLFGRIVIAKPRVPALAFDRMALGHAATVSALLLMHKERVADEARRLRGDVLDDLLAGKSPDDIRRALEGALEIGWDADLPHGVIVISTTGVESVAPGERIAVPGRPSRATSGRPASLARVVERTLQSAGRSFLMRERGGTVVALVQGSTADEIASVGETIRARWVSEGSGTTLRIGAGGPVLEIPQVPESARQAREAIRLGYLLTPPRAVVSWDDLGVFRVVAELDRRGSDLDALRKRSLRGLLTDTPRVHRLLETLTVYLRHNGSLQATASALCIHRQSLRYRLARVEALSGRQLHNSGHRLELHFGLAVHAYLEERPRRAAEGPRTHST